MATPGEALIALWWAAEEVPQIGALAQYGAIGIICALFVWFGYRAWKRETERADRLEAENRRLTDAVMDRAIPALTTAAGVMQEVQELLRDQQRDRAQGYRQG